jgi:hypothetical protein
LFKYGLFFVGVVNFIIVSFFFIKEKVSEKRYKNKHGNVIIEKENKTHIIASQYKKTGISYKFFLRNETNKSVTIKDKFILNTYEDKLFLFEDTDVILFDIGPEIYFGEYGLEVVDQKSQLAGIGGKYWETYNIPDDVEYGFIIVKSGEGDIATI